MGEFHPIAWYQEFDGGRSFYTALGHLDAVHQNLTFNHHLYGGLYWAATGKGILNKSANNKLELNDEEKLSSKTSVCNEK